MEAASFEKQIDQLAALQDIDTVIKEKQDRLSQLASEVETFQSNLDRRRADDLRLTNERTALEKRRRELDEGLASMAEKIKGSRMRMAQVRNEKELLAMQHEINVSRETTQQLEEQMLEVMEGLERVATEIAAVQETIRELEEQLESEIRPRQQEMEKLEGELSGERERRVATAEGMDAALRSKYEQIFSRRGGTAVVEVRSGTCQGCYMHVPPQLYNELLKTREARQCPNCGRILFWHPETDG